MHFVRLWVISALAALCAIFAVLAVWLLVHVGFDDEVKDLMLGYVTNARLVMLAVVLSALIGLIEATTLTLWYRRKAKQLSRPRPTTSVNAP
jgi:hypothetical protein